MTEAMRELRKRSPVEATFHPSSPLRVAVVEPYASGRDTVCACIEELGHAAVGATSLEHAAQLIAGGDDESIDLLIVAHYLPWIDGWGFVARLMSRPDLPAIIVCDVLDDRPAQQTPTLRRAFSLAELEHALSGIASNPLFRDRIGDHGPLADA